MSFEALALGVVSGLRPATSTAAVVALLRSPAAARMLVLFILPALAVSVTTGLLVVLLLNGLSVGSGRDRFDVIDTVLGVAALAFAAGLATGRVTVRRPRPDGE